MDKVNNKKIVSTKLVLTACLSCGLTIASAIVYIVLCSLAIHYRSNCNAGISSSADSSQFLQLFIGLYFKQDNCAHALLLDDITKEQTVFILGTLTLTVAVLSFIAAIICITVVIVEKAVKFVEAAAYSYIAIYIISLIIDLLTASYFGIDSNTISTLAVESNQNTLDIYSKELLRLGALFLMTISLKGFVFHIVNIILIILLIVYLVEYRRKLNSTAHAIHKLGALHSFEQRPNDDPWQQQSESSFQQFRGPPKSNDGSWQRQSENIFPPYKNSQMNPMFVNDEENRSQTREAPRADYLNPAFDRSYSWNQGSANSSRPFSYLEESKPPVPMKPPNSPSQNTQWQREREQWQPNLPVPDYSPETPRRLKSALKSSYM